MAHDPTAARRATRRLRDRRGRGMRGPLLPTDLPGARTRAEQFDQVVLEAVTDLEDRWPEELQGFEFAVDEVPTVPSDGGVPAGDDVVVDGGIPLTRFIPPGVDGKGHPTKARIVVYRRPLEIRSADAGDLGDLVAEVLGEQVGSILGHDLDDSAE